MLSIQLQQHRVVVVHATGEGDADVDIVRKAFEFHQHRDVVVVADDTDILLLLLHHTSVTHKVYLETNQNTVDIAVAQQALGDGVCKRLLFLHAFTGCDTTSAMFGVGKTKALKVLQSSHELAEEVLLFGDVNTPVAALSETGEKFTSALYGGGEKSRDELRYHLFTSPKYIPLESMPPTSRSCYYHCLRVHLQVATWRNLETHLRPEEFGFKTDNGVQTAIVTGNAHAPPEMLSKTRCSCKAAHPLCTACTCSKNRLPCSIHCKYGRQCNNSTPLQLNSRLPLLYYEVITT